MSENALERLSELNERIRDGLSDVNVDLKDVYAEVIRLSEQLADKVRDELAELNIRHAAELLALRSQQNSRTDFDIVWEQLLGRHLQERRDLFNKANELFQEMES